LEHFWRSFFSFSDGVLCFCLILCVVFLALVHRKYVCAHMDAIDIFSSVIILPDAASSDI
jgi:hypothetical protein